MHSTKTLVNKAFTAVLGYIPHSIINIRVVHRYNRKELTMMDYKELETMDRCDVAYIYAISSMRLYSRKIEKVTLYRKPNNKGRYVSTIGIYFSDSSDNTHTQYFKLYDDEYIWFLNAISNDFPTVPLEDLTEEKYKVVKTKAGEQHDVQASSET